MVWGVWSIQPFADLVAVLFNTKVPHSAPVRNV